MSRSTLRRALRRRCAVPHGYDHGGRLPAAADAAKVGVSAKRLNIQAGKPRDRQGPRRRRPATVTRLQIQRGRPLGDHRP